LEQQSSGYALFESESHVTDGPGTDRVPVCKDSVVLTSHD